MANVNKFQADIERIVDLNDVKLEVKDVNYLKNNFVSEYESVYKCFNYMTDKKISTLPIIDNNGKYLINFSCEVNRIFVANTIL